MITSRPKRLLLIVGIYLLFSIIIFCSTLIIWTYRTADEAIEKQLESSFQQRHAIIETIMENQLDILDVSLRQIRSMIEVVTGVRSQEEHRLQQALFSIMETDTGALFDILFIHLSENGNLINASSTFFETEAMIPRLINTPDSQMSAGLLIRFNAPAESLTILVKSIPVIHQPLGKVGGTLYGGIVLNNNLSLLEILKKRTNTSGIVLFSENLLIGSTDQRDTLTTQTLVQCKAVSGPGEIYVNNGIIASCNRIHLGSHDTVLWAVAGIPDQTLIELKHSYRNKITVIFLLSALYMGFALIMIRRVTSPSLNAITRYARKVSSGDLNTRYQAGGILELNQIGFAMEAMIENLKETNRQLNQEIVVRRQSENARLESETRYSGLLDRLNEAVFRMSLPEGDYEYFSKAAIDVFGYSSREFIEKPMLIKSILHPDFTGPFADEWEKLLSGDIPPFYEYKIFDPHGKERWIYQTNTGIYDENKTIVAIEGSCMDITDRKLTEIELAKYRDHLKEEVKERTRDLENAYERLKTAKESAEVANKAKSDFLARMSHEIRTPLNAVTGISHLMSQTELSDIQKDYLDKIQSSSQVLLGVINDILDYSRIEAGKMEIESTAFSLHDVLQNIAAIMSVRLENKSIEFLFDISPDVPRRLVGDPLRLEQILINLTNNSVKFTESGEIILKITTVSQMHDNGTFMLRFFVRDTGIGIDSDKINGLFSAFSQADSYMSRKYGGSGLGLAICKRLVELMGGEITAESRPGSGSTFMFTVCFKSCDISEMQVITPPRELSEMKVLVVDDCSTARHIILNLLKGLSFKTFAVASGEESIKEVEQRTLSPDNKPYDIVFMDWKMKGMNGIDASHIIKTGLNLPRPPKIIMLTAFGKEYILKKASQAGIDGFLTKPVTPSTIFDAVMELVGKKTMAKNLPFMKESKLTEALGTIRDARILVVEDNKVNQLLARKLLENVNLKVALADNGAEAIERLRNDEFDAVLMDIQMPVMNGYEATKAIREADASFSSIPVIAMTAHAMTGEREKCIEAGMSDYVTKPVNPEVLYTTLIRWISDRADS